MANEITEKIESAQVTIIEALEELKSSDEDHAEFYENLRERQAEIVRDLEAMLGETK